MEGSFDNLKQIRPAQIKKVFNNAIRSNNHYIAVDKKKEPKVLKVLKSAMREDDRLSALDRS
jgi:hypothetical protein